MKILVLLHPDLIPPQTSLSAKIDRNNSEWITEYDVISTLMDNNHQVEVLGVADDLKVIREKVEQFRPRIIYNLLEEFRGEAIFDQNVVSYLELLNVPYTGCNPKGLILARDKALSKKILTYHKIPTSKFQVIPRNQPQRKIRLKNYPLIVKCLNEEASLGLSQASLVRSEEKLRERIQFIHNNFHTDALVEEFVSGKEYFIGIIGNYRLEVLPVWALNFSNAEEPENEIYSSRAKFNDNYRHRKGISTGLADIDQITSKRLQLVAKRAYRALGLSGYARIDLRLNENGKIFVIEANPNPDISQTDEFAASAKSKDISYKQLLNKILKLGMQWNPANPTLSTAIISEP